MKSLLEIDSSEIERLTDVQLQRLLQLLVRSDLNRAKLSLALANITLKVDIPDGGLDAWVDWDGTPSAAMMLQFPRPIGIQVKATEIGPSGFADELFAAKSKKAAKKSTKLKSEVQRLLDNNGTYLAFYGREAPGVRGQDRITKVTQALQPFATGSFDVQLFDSAKIALWASQNIECYQYVAELTGSAPHPSFRSYEQWASLPRIPARYATDDQILLDFLGIRDAIASEGSVARIDGLAGLGKTRLALEALRPLHDTLDIVYVDRGLFDDRGILSAAIGTWARKGAQGLIVVDNCPLDEHEAISSMIAGSSLRLLTVDFQPAQASRGTALVHLERCSSDLIRKILVDMGASTLHADRFEALVRYVDGFPRFAVLFEGRFDSVTDLDGSTDDDFLRRLLWGRSQRDEEAYHVLTALSLFNQIGYRDQVVSELTWIRENMCASIPQHSFDGTVEKFRARQILNPVGRYFSVTPSPLAIDLARRYYANFNDAKRAAIFSESMPLSLVNAMAGQFENLSAVSEAATIAAEYLGASGPFGSAEVLKTKRGARIFRALSDVNREAGAEMLTRELGIMDRSELFALKGSRRDIVWALEKIAFNRDLFFDGARILAALADAETERLANSATGQLKLLFSPFLSATEADGEQRLSFIRELRTSGAQWAAIAVQCLASAFSLRNVSRRVGAEYQGGHVLQEWQPSADALKSYLNGAVDELVATAREDANLIAPVRKAFAHGIRDLAAFRMIDLIERGVSELAKSGGVWPDCVDMLRQATRFELREDNESRERVEKLLEIVTPSDLESRLKLFVSSPGLDVSLVDGHAVDHTSKNITNLLQEILSASQLTPTLKLLSAGQQVHGYLFGNELMRLIAEPDAVVNEAVEALAAACEDGSAQVLSGMLSGLRLIDESAASRWLQRISENEALRRHLVWLTAATQPADVDVLRLLPLLDERRVNATDSRAFAYGGSLRGVSQTVVMALVSSLINVDAVPEALMIMHMTVFGEDQLWAPFAPLFEAALLRWNMPRASLTTFEDHSAMSDLRRLLAEPGRDELARHVASQLLEVSVNPETEFQARLRAAEMWSILFSSYGPTLWPIVEQTIDQLNAQGRMYLFFCFRFMPAGSSEYRLALADLPVDVLQGWCERQPTYAPAYLAKELTVYSASGEQIAIDGFYAWLIRHFGNRKDVQQALYANLLQFTSVGPRAPYLDERIAALQVLAGEGTSAFKKWTVKALAEIRQHVKQEQERAAEFAGGIWST